MMLYTAKFIVSMEKTKNVDLASNFSPSFRKSKRKIIFIECPSKKMYSFKGYYQYTSFQTLVN